MKSTLQIFVALEEGKAALLRGQRNGRAIGRMANATHDLCRESQGALAAIGDAQHQQSVGEAGHAEPDAPRSFCLSSLLRQRKARDIDHIVQQAHGDMRRRSQRLQIRNGLQA